MKTLKELIENLLEENYQLEKQNEKLKKENKHLKELFNAYLNQH